MPPPLTVGALLNVIVFTGQELPTRLNNQQSHQNFCENKYTVIAAKSSEPQQFA